ncbi:cation transporter [Rhizobiaceae bacterium BDR2-2]|uniref:Cation transporter n=1 Tax=Ectorhizobium quercum TaxID=2965071 RepID=A0AAE3N0W2_9HYPH|nr:cation transporter [Ectorhizobium quercum]MCX8996767.1 cation transporter [Ectorhizobium quercum]
MRSEQFVLRLSIAVTFLVAVAGVFFGLLSGSSAIVFDGVYSLADVTMTLAALVVSNLIATSTARGPSRNRLAERFTMGFWHLEPMVLGVSGTLLIGAAVYALINAIGSIIDGGRVLNFDQGILYAALVACVAVVMAIYSGRASRVLKSGFVALDAKAWWMSAALSGALLLAFAFGLLIQGTALEWMSPYIDPAILALVCLVIIPVPVGTVKQALADVLLITPAADKRHVDGVAEEIVRRYGFSAFRSYVARVGRGRQIELYFIVPSGGPARRLEEWDDIRNAVGEAIGGEGPDRWLTIVFTTDPEWAE